MSEIFLYTFNERLKMLIKLLNHTGNSFANALEVNPSAINTVIGPRQSKPSTDLLEKIKLKFPRSNMDWLISEIGEPLHPLKGEDQNHSSRNFSGNTGSLQQISGSNNILIMGELESCKKMNAVLEKRINDKDELISLLKQQIAK